MGDLERGRTVEAAEDARSALVVAREARYPVDEAPSPSAGDLAAARDACACAAGLDRCREVGDLWSQEILDLMPVLDLRAGRFENAAVTARGRGRSLCHRRCPAEVAECLAGSAGWLPLG